MGLIIKFFSFLLVLGVAGLFFIKKPDGSAWLSLDDFTPDTSAIKRSISDAMPDQVVGGSDGDKVSVYKWKDAEGNWQFSDKPPTGIEAKQVLVGTDVNRDLAPLPPPTRTPSSDSSGGKALLIKDSGFSPTTISPDKISTLVDDANGVQELMDNRQKQLDDAINSAK
ncbi:MAG: DUF4124 domain-containing protein [Cellvibrionaceae bacterium]